MGIPTIATAAAGAASGGKSPILGSALIELGSGLFKGLFGGMGRKAEDKRKWELFMKRMKMIKPTGKYSRGVDPITEQAIMNMFKTRGMQIPQYDQPDEASAGVRRRGGMLAPRNKNIKRRI